MWRKQTAQGVCFKNKRQPNSREHESCWGWQRHKTRLLWLMWPSTQRIGKEIKASSLFSRRAADVISEIFFTATTGDRSRSHIILVSFWIYFLNTKLYMLTSLAELPYVILKSNWPWKPSILGLSIAFCLWIYFLASYALSLFGSHGLLSPFKNILLNEQPAAVCGNSNRIAPLRNFKCLKPGLRRFLFFRSWSANFPTT